MSEPSRREVRVGLEPSLAGLWRYALVLSRARDVADDLVQATCLRAISAALAEAGYFNERSAPFNPASVNKMLAR
jgi:DNA-directed RNA polymerase specialized sigma24 family protein